MKSTKILIPVLFFAWGPLFAQPAALPVFLEGDWKMENQEIYEHWEVLEDGSMEGHSYRMNGEEKVITEKLQIRRVGNKVIYTATVANQNEGKGVDFILNRPDSLTFSFENPERDFPKVIRYEKRSDSEIYVQVSDGGKQGFAYVMRKMIPGASNLLTDFFKDITGVWQAAPSDSSFISRLEYEKSEEHFLLIARNTLSSKSGKRFAAYEGVYIYNPVEGLIQFHTITNSEIHTGTCRVSGDTLFHAARISGSGKIKSYSSALIKKEDGTIHYYADYSESETIPELTYSTPPLIYRKQQ